MLLVGIVSARDMWFAVEVICAVACTLSLRNGFKKSLAPHLRGLRALGISRSAGLRVSAIFGA